MAPPLPVSPTHDATSRPVRSTGPRARPRSPRPPSRDRAQPCCIDDGQHGQAEPTADFGGPPGQPEGCRARPPRRRRERAGPWPRQPRAARPGGSLARRASSAPGRRFRSTTSSGLRPIRARTDGLCTAHPGAPPTQCERPHGCARPYASTTLKRAGSSDRELGNGAPRVSRTAPGGLGPGKSAEAAVAGIPR